MPRILRPGAIKNGYKIIKFVNRGAFAVAYEAISKSGNPVFLKQYRLPNPSMEWFSDFVNHQFEIKHCIESDHIASKLCYRFIEFFVEHGFYQVFELVDGKPLTHLLGDVSALSWQQRVSLSRAMMFGIKTLHDKYIVHSDLKPDNIILIQDPACDLGHQLKIIDLDWAFFSDRQAPWDGKQGYVGSHHFMSPEHIDGKVPSQASDMFSCGIILGLLLGGQHPFYKNLDETYNHSAFKGRYSPIHTMQPIEGIENMAFLEATINACLDAKSSNRPTAYAVCRALNGY